MSQIGRRFRLSEQWDHGVFCSEDGAFLSGIPLLERDSGEEWRPRPVSDLNRDLSKRYGLPVELGRKMHGLEAIAKRSAAVTLFTRGSRRCTWKFLIRPR